MTYSQAIAKVMYDNGGFASLKFIYQNIEKYRKNTGKTPDKSIQERVQRDEKFTRIASGVYALTELIDEIENKGLGNFIFKNKKITFQQTTEKEITTKTRIGQERFKKALVKDVGSICPITKINNPKLLIAGHIKPWCHSSNAEKINPKNGILLSPLFDKLFDMRVGFITFTPDKRIWLSKKLAKDITKLGVRNGEIIKNLNFKGREIFLDYHRAKIFQK